MTIQTEPEVFWYLPEHLTEAQKDSLKLFKEALAKAGTLLQDSHGDDATLLRFLKARHWNVEPAVLMYTNMVKWRAEQKVDQLYATYGFPELHDIVQHYPHFYHKQDKYGRPVYIELLGVTDCSKMLSVAPLERIMQYHIWTWERLERQLMPACSQLKGHPIIACTVIIDLAGLCFGSFSLTAQRLLHTIAKVDQDYYPEHLGTMFIINTPYIFKAIWAVVHPMLEERTRKKITVLGSDYQAKLKQLIPEENLPTIFGGQSVCPDHLNSIGAWTSVEPCKSSSWLPASTSAAPCSADKLAPVLTDLPAPTPTSGDGAAALCELANLKLSAANADVSCKGGSIKSAVDGTPAAAELMTADGGL